MAELHDYLKSEGGGIRLIQPDTTPPRLSDDAKAAIRRLAATVLKQRVDKSEVQSLMNAAEQLAPKQPEPKLVGAIALMKARRGERGPGLAWQCRGGPSQDFAGVGGERLDPV